MFTTNDEEFQEGPERNSLFDQVDEDDDETEDLCENCGDDGDVQATETPAGQQSLCGECRLAHGAFDDEAVAEVRAAAR